MTWQSTLIQWYNDNKRDLPFRNTTDPYKIWVSEIMLQQTTVNAVISYYNRFIRRFPDVNALADADLETVYKYWEGLGYYRRAKHLHESAQIIKAQGYFPDTYEELLTLKGVGAYTASAIMAFSYHESYGAVDGNVLRVIARLYAIKDNIIETSTIKKITEIVNQDIKDYDPSAFNQGLMDFANAICTPRSPKCMQCPLSFYCQSHHDQLTQILPIRIKKVKRSENSYISGIITYQDQLLLIQNKQGLLENLYGLIQYETDSPYAFIELFEREFHSTLHIDHFINDYKHVFTHKTWFMHAYHFVLDEPSRLPLYSVKALKKLPIPTAHKKIIDDYLKTFVD